MSASGEWDNSAAPRRPWLWVAAAVCTAAVVGVLIGSDGEVLGELAVEEATAEPDPAPENPPSVGGRATAPPVAGLGVLGGRWREHPAPPMGMPSSFTGAWTGEELVVLGPTRSAAAFVPGEGWRALPPFPGSQRADVAVAWTGEEVVVLGGVAPGLLDPFVRNGAAYDPRVGVWGRLPSAPIAPVAPFVAAWTGQEVLWWGASRPGRGRLAGGPQEPVGVALDPATDRWRVLPGAPLDHVSGADALWDGTRLLVWGSTQRLNADGSLSGVREPFLLAFSPGDGRWERLPPPPLFAPEGAAAVWTGDELLLWGAEASSPGDGAAVGARFGADGIWRALPALPPDPRLDSALAGARAVWTGRFALFYGGREGAVGLAFVPDDDVWLSLTGGPAQRGFALARWTGSSLLLWGGHDEAARVSELVEFVPFRRLQLRPPGLRRVPQ